MTEYVDEARLRKHVEALASDIGERNVSKPESLAAASSYIEAEWRTQGYDVAKQVYEADGVVWYGGSSLVKATKRTARRGEIPANSRDSSSNAAMPLALSSAPGLPETVS